MTYRKFERDGTEEPDTYEPVEDIPDPYYPDTAA